MRIPVCVLLSMAISCSVELPNNAFECTLDSECPASFLCFDGRCWREALVDAARADDAASDARDGGAGDASADADGVDADAGPDVVDSADALGDTGDTGDTGDAGDAGDEPVPCADINLALNGVSTVRAIAHDANGDIYIAGFFAGNLALGELEVRSVGGADLFVARIDAGGTVRWLQSDGGSMDDVGTAIAVSESGRVLVVGETGEDADVAGVWMELARRDGAVRRRVVQPLSRYTGIAVRGEDSFVTGSRLSAAGGDEDAIVDEIDSAANVAEVRRYEGGVALHAILDHAGSFWVAGTNGLRARAYLIEDIRRPVMGDLVFDGPTPATNISSFRAIAANGDQVVFVGDVGVFALAMGRLAGGSLVQQLPVDQPGKWFGVTFDDAGEIFVGRQPTGTGQLPMSGRFGANASVDRDPDPDANNTAFAMTRSERCGRTFVGGRFRGTIAGMTTNQLSGYVITR